MVGFAFGSKALYEYLDHNEKMFFGPFPVVNNPVNIAKNDNMISINTAMSIDLFGQVAAEGHGAEPVQRHRRPGGLCPGGSAGQGGNPSLPLSPPWAPIPTAPQKPHRALFPPATIVTTPRSDVEYVVTEYGEVNLKTLTMRDRTRALISLAHPDCRPELTAQAKKMGIL